MKIQSNFIEITLWYGCSPVNLLHIFRTPFSQEHLWRAASANCIIFIKSMTDNGNGISLPELRDNNEDVIFNNS